MLLPDMTLNSIRIQTSFLQTESLKLNYFEKAKSKLLPFPFVIFQQVLCTCGLGTVDNCTYSKQFVNFPMVSLVRHKLV